MADFVVGQKAQIEKIFSLEDVIAYAKLTGDNNPLHVNPEYAKESRFGDNIVHGMFVMGVISKILGTVLPGNGTIYLGQDVRFKKPVYVNQKVIIQVEITQIEEERNLIYLSTSVWDTEGKCLVEGNAKVLYER
ncbi:MAG: MaoC family dehydratase [Lachnospiraceae bacterium]|nr:MaoC family dehydratase [Lachnospiraceae bacterium]